MALDYGYTCPDIDRSIAEFKCDIGSYLSNMLDDCCPMLEGEQKEYFIKDYVEQMYIDFQANFEDVRKVNEGIRSEADKQIDFAECRLADAEEEIRYLSARVEELEGQLAEL